MKGLTSVYIVPAAGTLVPTPSHSAEGNLFVGSDDRVLYLKKSDGTIKAAQVGAVNVIFEA